mmetsp:Transcript_59269/g.129789  ORF Transcript_59269/g.129789 Transcript_59269/m.129789 type:complete len:1046 (+) Transcript_59269:3-3140(+)
MFGLLAVATALAALPQYPRMSSAHGIMRHRGRMVALSLLDDDESAGDFVQKPATHANRQYRYKTLSSGMQMLMVSDPDTTSSGYSMAVKVGSFYDPPELPGLAHFCEHMLFLGTEEFPDPDEYSDFLAARGGSSNAYTASEATVYQNEIGTDYLQDALERFSGFFINPLFNKSSAEGEVEAVNSEHEKNKPESTWQMFRLLTKLATPNSPVAHFSTGNKETLWDGPKSKGVDTSDELRKWHKKHYCANRMAFVVFSELDLDVLEKMATPIMEKVSNRDECVVATDFGKEPFPYPPSTLGNLLRVETSSPRPLLWLHFPLADVNPLFATLPHVVASWILGYGGKGWVGSELRKQELVTGFDAGVAETSTAVAHFVVQFELSETGMQDIDKVVQVFFQAVKDQTRAGVQRDVVVGLQKKMNASFEYQPVTTDAMEIPCTLAPILHLYPAQKVLTAGSLIEVVNTTAVRAILEQLNPRNMNMLFMDPTFENGTVEDEFYPMRYTQSKFDASSFGAQVQSNLVVPTAAFTRYVPQKLEIVKSSKATDFPSRVHSEDGLDVWWKGQGMYLGDKSFVPLPKAAVQIGVHLAEGVLVTATEVALAQAFVEAFTDDLSENFADALGGSGIGVEVKVAEGRLDFQFGGFDDRMEAVVDLILDSIWSFKVDNRTWDRSVATLKLDMEDVSSSMPIQLVKEDFNAFVSKDGLRRKDMVEAVSNATEMTQDKMRVVMQAALSRARIDVLVVGNIGQDRAVQLSQKVKESLRNATDFETITPAEQQMQLVRRPAEDDTQLRVANPLPEDKNNAVYTAVSFPAPATAGDMLAWVAMGSVIHQEAFNYLRTVRGMGYVAGATVQPRNRGPWTLAVYVQGTKEAPEAARNATLKVLEDFADTLKATNDDHVKAWVAGAVGQLSQKPTSFSDEVTMAWPHIADGKPCFHRRSAMVAAAPSVNKQTLLSAYAMVKLGSEGSAKRISAMMYGEGVDFIPSTDDELKALKLEISPQKEGGAASDILKLAMDENDDSFFEPVAACPSGAASWMMLPILTWLALVTL